MNNLRLLKKHKRKVTLLFSGLIFLFVFTVIIIFEFTSAYFNNKNENKALIAQAEQVRAITKTYDTLTMTGDKDLEKIIDEVLLNTYIYSKNGVLVDNLNLAHIHDYNFPQHSVTRIQGRKFYSTYASRDNVRYGIIISKPYKSIQELMGITIVIMFMAGPLFYLLLTYLCGYCINRVYKPLEGTIINLESFAGNINHEFKTGLTEIISSLELARETGQYSEANEYAVTSSHRLNAILDSLGALIHLVDSDYRKENIDIVSVLEGCLEDFQGLLGEKNLKIIKKYPENKAVFRYIDTSPLILTFQNIMKNAIKYSKNGGDIEIDISKNYFKIKDYGLGIEKENLDKIFERYFQESYMKSGSGIGLSIIQHITKIYNWKIDIKSEKNNFTEVSIYF